MNIRKRSEVSLRYGNSYLQACGEPAVLIAIGVATMLVLWGVAAMIKTNNSLNNN